MNNIASNYATTAAANSPAAATSTGSSSSNLGASNVGNTFLSLLVKELQNQDPTAPMDSTAMVGQMISLNQLEVMTAMRIESRTRRWSYVPESRVGGAVMRRTCTATFYARGIHRQRGAEVSPGRRTSDLYVLFSWSIGWKRVMRPRSVARIPRLLMDLRGIR